MEKEPKLTPDQEKIIRESRLVLDHSEEMKSAIKNKLDRYEGDESENLREARENKKMPGDEEEGEN